MAEAVKLLCGECDIKIVLQDFFFCSCGLHLMPQIPDKLNQFWSIEKKSSTTKILKIAEKSIEIFVALGIDAPLLLMFCCASHKIFNGRFMRFILLNQSASGQCPRDKAA
jgi:hypothetical protein